MFKKCLVNRIACKNDDYKCYLCHNLMKQSRFDVVEEHLLSEKHQERLNHIDEQQRIKEFEKLSTLRGPELKRIVENNVTLDRNFNMLNCRICNCKISGLSNTLEHIDGFLHRENWSNLNEQNKKAEQKAKKLLCDNVDTNQTAVVKTVTFQASIPPLQPDSNGIISNEQNNSHYCSICKMRIIATPNISQHNQGSVHQVMESNFKTLNPNSKSDYIIYDEKCNSYECSICKCKIVCTPNVTQHIQGFMHQRMLKAQNATKTKSIKNQEFLNQTTLKTKQDIGLEEQFDFKSHFTEIYFCRACQVFIKNSALFKCHMVLHLYQECDALKNFDLIKFESKANKKLRLDCLLCNSFICKSDIQHADQALVKHLETEMHLDRLTIFGRDSTNSDLRMPTMNHQLKNVNLEKLTDKPKRNISLQLLCNFCNVPVFKNNVADHALGKNHIKKVSENAASNAASLQKIELSSTEKSQYYICFMCDKSFAQSLDLLNHFKTPQHQFKIISLNMIVKSPYMKIQKKISNMKSYAMIECLTCKKVEIYCFMSAVAHMIGRKHKEEVKLPSSNLKNLNTTLLAEVTNGFQKMSVKPTNQSSKITSNANSIKQQNLPIIKAKSVKKVKEAHKFEANVEELNLLGFNTENIQPFSTLGLDMADKLLGDLCSPGFDKIKARRLPSNAKIKLPRTPKIEDQRNSFATNVLYYGKTFIKYCIDPGQENIFNLDNEQITLMKCGVPLTFPFNSNRVCMPCGEEFPNDVQFLFEHLQHQEHLKNICSMIIDDKEFEKFPEQFSDLRLANLYMHLSDQSIHCYACDIEVQDNDDIIRQHAKTPIHEVKSKLWKEESEQLFDQYLTVYKDIWYYAENFFCEICKKRCDLEIDFAIHLINPEHMKKVYELKHKGTALRHDLCPPCTTYWFGKADSYDFHCKNDYHKLLVNKKDFIIPNLTIHALEYLDDIDVNADHLVGQSDEADLQKDKVTELLEAVQEAVKPTYPDAKAYVFGSRTSQLGFPDSDVDIFLDCENVYYRSSTKKQSQEYIESVESYFDNSPNAWKMDDVLKATRVPILKMGHIPTNLHCDISFSNGLSVEKSKLIGKYNRAFPICRKLILFMKKWLTLCRLASPDCITTFAISWCVIFYLQLQQVLPSVHELIKRKMESKIVDGWECGFEESITVGSSNLTFKQHLKGFFSYFAKFDYQKDVVCPYMSKTIDKHSFAHAEKLASEMDIYTRRLKNNEVEIFRFDSPMCIQDPIDLSQNLTKALSKKHLRRFRQYCMLSAEKC